MVVWSFVETRGREELEAGKPSASAGALTVFQVHCENSLECTDRQQFRYKWGDLSRLVL